MRFPNVFWPILEFSTKVHPVFPKFEDAYLVEDRLRLYIDAF